MGADQADMDTPIAQIQEILNKDVLSFSDLGHIAAELDKLEDEVLLEDDERKLHMIMNTIDKKRVTGDGSEQKKNEIQAIIAHLLEENE